MADSSFEQDCDFGAAISTPREEIDYFSDNGSVFHVVPVTVDTKLKRDSHDKEEKDQEGKGEAHSIGATFLSGGHRANGEEDEALEKGGQGHQQQKSSSSVDSDAVIERNREYFENLRRCYDVNGDVDPLMHLDRARFRNDPTWQYCYEDCTVNCFLYN